MHKPKAPRTHFEELQTFTRVVTVQKSGGASPDRKRRTKTYQQVYFKKVRTPIPADDGLGTNFFWEKKPEMRYGP